MRKTVLTFGLIASAIIITLMFGARPLWKNGTITYENGELIGYTSMVIALSMIFFGIKSYRDNHLKGAITFGKAIQVGFLIALVASLSYAIAWEFYLNLFEPNFMEEYAALCISKAKNEGLPEAEVQKIIESMDTMKAYYKNPLIRFGITLTEIFPLGILIALISSAILRKKEILPSTPIA